MNQRTKRLEILMTEEQHARLTVEAQREQMGLGQYCRMRLGLEKRAQVKKRAKSAA